MSDHFDVAIIGGGIVGLATALGLLEARPGLRLVVFEKETRVGQHQTGHNSGVVHSGVYYKPGSLKAKLCVDGVRKLRTFCEIEGLAYEEYGKILVAVDQSEIPALEEIHRRGIANGVQSLRKLDPGGIREIEPNAAGVKALYVPATGIVDYTRVAEAYANKIRAAGAEIRTSSRVSAIIISRGEIILQSASGDYRTNHLINCCGLYSDLIAKTMATGDAEGQHEEHRIIPFRGEYYKLTAEKYHLVRNLIYPVPDPAFPFLGVHFTRMIKGGVEAGPNAVLAFSREGYRKTDFSIGDLWRILSYKGFWAMAGKYWQTGCGEFYRSFSKQAFVKALQKLLPEVTPHDLVVGGSGVRAQAVSSNGALVDDFVIKQSRNAIHVLNAPSPGATASLAIGQSIAEIAAKHFALKN